MRLLTREEIKKIENIVKLKYLKRTEKENVEDGLLTAHYTFRSKKNPNNDKMDWICWEINIRINQNDEKDSNIWYDHYGIREAVFSFDTKRVVDLDYEEKMIEDLLENVKNEEIVL